MSVEMQTKSAVMEGMSDHPAVKALTAVSAIWKPEWFTDAKHDRGELTVSVAPEAICAAARQLQAAGYNFFEDMTAVDWFPAEPRFQLSYHLLSHKFKEHIRLRTFVGDAIDSITSVWPSANFYEREVFDLFGVRFNGHPNLVRIMLPDEFDGHPLRKDYPVEGYR